MKKTFYTLLLLFICLPLQAQIDRSQQPQSGPSPEIQLEQPQEFTLKNGLRVLVVENHKLPRASANLNIDLAPVFEGELAGVSALLSSMLGKGSQSIEKNVFEEEVDFLGARLSFGSYKELSNSTILRLPPM